jgi:hypothetical protein
VAAAAAAAAAAAFFLGIKVTMVSKVFSHALTSFLPSSASTSSCSSVVLRRPSSPPSLLSSSRRLFTRLFLTAFTTRFEETPQLNSTPATLWLQL